MTTDTPPTPSKLAMCVDPVLTYWNPYDVPVSLHPAYNSIRFEKIPYQINDLSVNGVSVGSVNLGGRGDRVFAESDYNYTTMRAGKTVPAVLMPGEVLMLSQGSNTTPHQAIDGSTIQVEGAPGFNFGGGIYYLLKDTGGMDIDVPSGLSQVPVSFSSLSPNNEIINQGVGEGVPISINHTETYLFEDRQRQGPSVGIGGVAVDHWRGTPPYTNPKSGTDRFTATQKTAVFKTVAGNSFNLSTSGNTSDRKTWFFYYGYDVKSEADALRPGQFLSRFNPSAAFVDFADLSPLELDVMPFEVRIIGNSDGDTRPPRIMDSDSAGRGYFGGGTTSRDGTTTISTHSVPQEPLVSLAALQHSQANGFNRIKPDKSEPYYDTYVTNQIIRLPMLPQVAHAIGNSLASPVLAADQTQGTLGYRPLADHSYLANAALWDDWFFSGIAPTITPTHSGGLSQKQVAKAFLEDSSPLPVARYRPDLGTETPENALARLISGSKPSPAAPSLTAMWIRVDGLFNVNSTSVQAWKAVLGGLKNHPIITRNAGAGSLTQTTDASTPVAAMLAPVDLVSTGSPTTRDAPQWTGRRTLTDEELDTLAGKLVEEVRKRGPFISLADFINRRPNDAGLARAGAIQSAIDAADLNHGFASRMASASPSLAYGAAESGSPSAQGIPGIVKQADILTPIAPILSVRSDTFIIRGYGEALDKADKVIARACCEAVVERDFEFVDPSDTRETALTDLNPVNRRFGRRFSMLGFRWLPPTEI